MPGQGYQNFNPAASFAPQHGPSTVANGFQYNPLAIVPSLPRNTLAMIPSDAKKSIHLEPFTGDYACVEFRDWFPLFDRLCKCKELMLAPGE